MRVLSLEDFKELCYEKKIESEREKQKQELLYEDYKNDILSQITRHKRINLKARRGCYERQR